MTLNFFRWSLSERSHQCSHRSSWNWDDSAVTICGKAYHAGLLVSFLWTFLLSFYYLRGVGRRKSTY